MQPGITCGNRGRGLTSLLVAGKEQAGVRAVIVVFTRDYLPIGVDKGEAERLREEIFALTRKAEGFVGSVVMASREDPTKHVRITMWESYADREAFHTSPEFQDLRERMWHLWSPSQVQEFYEVLASTRGENGAISLF